jgi:hypothetical protein
MMTVPIPRRAAADEKAVMGLLSRRVCWLPSEYNGPWRQEDSWQLDAGARWVGSASRVWLRLWLGFWEPSGDPDSERGS